MCDAISFSFMTSWGTRWPRSALTFSLRVTYNIGALAWGVGEGEREVLSWKDGKEEKESVLESRAACLQTQTFPMPLLKRLF